MPLIVAFRGISPRIAASAFIAENATIVGDVEIGENASVWFGAVVRADFAHIRIGANCNLQDNVVAHAESRETGLVLEDDVTVGHGAILHGSRVGKGCLIGMGAILLSRSVIGANSLIAAGSVVREDAFIPGNSVAAGNPAVVKKELEGSAARWAASGADSYVRLVRQFREADS